jgi:uncharacterized damage-inducible protein DinB
MSVGLSFTELIDYTGWERGLWYEWLRQRGDQVLAISAGPHGDGRFQVIGDIIRHIFSAEKRYIERLLNQPLTDPAAIPNNSIEVLFDFGRQSRQNLNSFVEHFPAQEWDGFREFPLMNSILKATPKKIIVHTLMHEIRHWAQIGTLLRLQGLTGEFHDFLFSPVLGGEMKKQAS